MANYAARGGNSRVRFTAHQRASPPLLPLYSVSGPTYTTRGSASSTSSPSRQFDSEAATLGSPRSSASTTSEIISIGSSDLRNEAEEEQRYMEEERLRMEHNLAFLESQYSWWTYGDLAIAWGRKQDPPSQVRI